MNRWLNLTEAEIAQKSAVNRAARTVRLMEKDKPGPKTPEIQPKKPHKSRVLSEGEETLALQFLAEKLQGWEREVFFAPPRKWRADFAFKDHRLLIEVEGGTWIQGRHNRGSSIEADLEKYNAAVLGKWSVLRFTTQQVKNGTALATIKHFLEQVRV